MSGPRSPSQMLPTNRSFAPIGGVSAYLLDVFGGSALDLKKWEVETQTGTISYSVANSALIVQMGTVANSELRLLSREVYSLPVDLIVTFLMSQRIANQGVFFELVEVDDNGDPIPHSTLPNEWRNRATMRFYGATATTQFLNMLCGDSPVSFEQSGTIGSTAAVMDVALEAKTNETYLSATNTDSTGVRIATALRSSRSSLDPNAKYKVRLRFKNDAVAPASNTTVTIHKVFAEDYIDIPVEISGGRGDLGVGKSIPAQITNTPNVAISGTPSVSLAANQVLSLTNLPANRVVDAASGALTATATLNSTTANVPFGGTVQFNIAVTAVTGTNPTLDIAIEESLDGGTNWIKRWDMPRIAAVGSYNSPRLPNTGSNVWRLVQTVGGTTPSFTRAISKNYQAQDISRVERQLIDRTLNPATTNSATPWLDIEGCKDVFANLNLTAWATGLTLQLQVSDDQVAIRNAASLSPTATGLQELVALNQKYKWARLLVSAGVAGNVSGYASVKGTE